MDIAHFPLYMHVVTGYPAPLPPIPGTRYQPLKWHIYSFLTKQWEKVPDPVDELAENQPAHPTPKKGDSDITMVTWNVDANAYEHKARLTALLAELQHAGQEGAPDIVFLQELSGIGKHTLAANDWVRANYYVAGLDWMLNDRNQPFYNATLMHRGRFVRGSRCQGYPCLGGCQAVWYPSQYQRYALCCDILSPLQSSMKEKVVRLVNVHLDDLAWATSLRPRQFVVIAQVSHTGGIGAGLVAGDFNPDTSSATKDDDKAVSQSGLQDCWTTLRGDASEFPGITWGLNGKRAGLMETRPPGRLEKVLMWGITPKTIEIIDPGKVPMEVPATIVDRQGNPVPHDPANEPRQIPWSEHSGLVVTFALPPPGDGLETAAAMLPAPPEATPTGGDNPDDADNPGNADTQPPTQSGARLAIPPLTLSANPVPMLMDRDLELMTNEELSAAVATPAWPPADPSNRAEIKALFERLAPVDSGRVGDAGGSGPTGPTGPTGEAGEAGTTGGSGVGGGEQSGETGRAGEAGAAGGGEQAGQAGQAGEGEETGETGKDGEAGKSEEMGDSFVVL